MPASATTPLRQHLKPAVGLTDDCRTKRSNKPASDDPRFSVHPKLFVFFDKKTGSRRFEVPAGLDGRIPVDQAASLLAIHCVARQQLPSDFSIMVSASEDLATGLAGPAKKLIQSCSVPVSPVPLTRRQHEVLGAIAHNLTNKEIAVGLHVSERTVKFHVSSLLAKFEVRRRSQLMLEAFDLVPSGRLCNPQASLHAPVSHDDVKNSPLFAPGLLASAPRSIERRSGR
jgi:DNA-binding CsgD family transcriptional regulator